MSEFVKNTSDAQFQTDVLDSTKPVLVDFWAPWCGPCKMIAPLLEETAQQFSDRITVMKVNVDENNEMPEKYGVRGIPSLMLFKQGDVVATKVGALNKAQLAAF